MKKEMKNQIPLPSWSSFSPTAGGAGGSSIGLRQGNLEEALMVLSFEAHRAMTLADNGTMMDLLLFEIEGFRPSGNIEQEERISLLFPLGMTPPVVIEILKAVRHIEDEKPELSLTQGDVNTLTKAGLEPVLMWRDKAGECLTTEEAALYHLSKEETAK